MEVSAHCDDVYEGEYDRLLALAGRLMEKEELTPEEGKLLELLAILIEDYDDRKVSAELFL